jgi:hypothetical protein
MSLVFIIADILVLLVKQALIMADIFRNRKQDGGRQTGNRSNLRCRTDRIEILSATPMFSGSPFSADSSPTLVYIDRVTATSGLVAAILCFQCRTMSAFVADESIETGNPENMGVAFIISILSVLERELQLLPVWFRHLVFLVSDDCRRMSAVSPLRWATRKTRV